MSDKWIDYTVHTPICIKVTSSKKVHMEYSRSKAWLDIIFPLDGQSGVARKWGNWLIECLQDKIYLFSCRKVESDEIIKITFNDGPTDLQICEETHPEQKSNFSGVEKIELSSKGALITVAEMGRTRCGDEKKQTSDTGNDGKIQQSGINVILVSEHEKLMAEKELSISLMNKQLMECQKENEKLQSLLGVQLNSILDTLSDDTIKLSEEHENVLSELKNKDAKNEIIRASIVELKEKIIRTEENKKTEEENLHKQERALDQLKQALNGVKEAVEMKADEAASYQCEIQDLARRAKLDQATLLLLEDGTSLINNSVPETLNSASLAIEAAEKRIQLIIQRLINEVTDARMTYADMISYYDEIKRIHAGIKEEGYISINSFLDKLQDMNEQGDNLMASYDQLLRGITTDVEALQSKIEKKLKPDVID